MIGTRRATRKAPRQHRRHSAATLAALTALALVGTVALAGCGSLSPVTTPTRFDQGLPIPPLAESSIDKNGTRVFNLTAEAGATEFQPGISTATMGFNGSYLGPTLRAERGETVAVHVKNQLDVTTSVHWHGMHLPAAMDGGPHQEVTPGATWTPEWTVDQSAATLWYHPHPHGETEEHVYRGLAGMFILDDPVSAVSGLPSQYGVDDIPLIVQDKDFTADGQLNVDSEGSEIGLLGGTVMVNGTIGAYQEITAEKTRLRLLNASTARIYNFGFDDERTFQLVATDGGLLRAPLPQQSIQLSPGERAEIVVAMEPGTTTMLRSSNPDLGNVVAPFTVGANDSFDVLELRAATELEQSPDLRTEMADFQINESEASVTRTFQLEGREINSRKMDMGRIDETVTLGATEIWEVQNRNLSPHSFHIHDVQFQILSIDGAAPPPHLAGKKDTVYLSPRKIYRLIMTFEDYADPEVPYMYHCHLLLHEDQGMMGQFVVVEPGDSAPTAPRQDDPHHH